MWTQTYSRLIAALLFLFLLRGAQAQPMMLDPSKMSGIPRPDPQVPTGTVTVRLIRGELSNRIVDATVELASQAEPDKPALTAKTDAEGRATFSGLSAAIYQAQASVDGQTLSSQPIEVMLAPAPGIRVMLVFPKSVADQQKELGTPDGKARIDVNAAAGTLLIKALDAGGAPLPGLRVVLLRASRDSDKVENVGQKLTAADGTVTYTGLSTGNNQGYMASVQRDGSEHRSQPFAMAADHGSILAMTVHNTSREVGSLYLGQGSHFILEPQDDTVQVMENLILINPLPQPVDPGPGGVRIPLAVDSLSPQVLPGGPASVSIDATQKGAPAVVWKGPVPSGQSMISVGLFLKHRGTLNFRQDVGGVRFEGLRVGVAKLPELHVEGITDVEERNLNGREFLVASAVVPKHGGTIELTLQGLPTDFYVLRYIAALGALGIALIFVFITVRGGASASDEAEAEKQRQKLMARRELLLDELLRVEQAESGAAAEGPKPAGKAKARTAAQIRTELEELYRKLDESDGPGTATA